MQSLGALDDMVLDSPPSSHSHDDPFAACPDSPLTLHTPPSLPSLDGTEDSDDGATGQCPSTMRTGYPYAFICRPVLRLYGRQGSRGIYTFR